MVLCITDKKMRIKGKEMGNFTMQMGDYMRGNGIKEEWKVWEPFTILREDWLIMALGRMISNNYYYC